ncbi:diphosphate--fructose-6-phosphate 1-phosphotransferase [Candidatus Magnetomorum sp. HK-1]|nr:diphosphate--fructose-6-phosphate 1-phosphotransferase [Candidatus Magnetomorum sp. HK-1]
MNIQNQMIDDSLDTEIHTLGQPLTNSPIQYQSGKSSPYFVSDTERILVDIDYQTWINRCETDSSPASFELAGPRSKIYFDPGKVKCAIVTCGGLCPGLNDIIRSIVLELNYAYGVSNVLGIKYGLQGFVPEYRHELIELTPERVESIHALGGTILGSSRERQDVNIIVNALDRLNIGILFMVGGDGTLAAANHISEEIEKNGLKISVVVIPKTIDNDIFMISRSFGFDTAVEHAATAIRSAHAEASGYLNGIGLLKLMGRNAGFIAATAALAQQDVNFVLVPEVDFDLYGQGGFFTSLKKRLLERKHAVVVVAEGAGRKFFSNDPDNLKKNDIGLFLKNEIADYFHHQSIKINLKYIDPSYIIRSLPANSNDHAFCNFLGRDAVHAGISGKSRLIIGYWNDRFVHIPLKLCAGKRKQIQPNSKLWAGVLESTGQGALVASKK